MHGRVKRTPFLRMSTSNAVLINKNAKEVLFLLRRSVPGSKLCSDQEWRDFQSFGQSYTFFHCVMTHFCYSQYFFSDAFFHGTFFLKVLFYTAENKMDSVLLVSHPWKNLKKHGRISVRDMEKNIFYIRIYMYNYIQRFRVGLKPDTDTDTLILFWRI